MACLLRILSVASVFLVRPSAAVRRGHPVALEEKEDQEVKYFADVPVYNYHRAFQVLSLNDTGIRPSSLAERATAEATVRSDWLIFPKPGVSQAVLAFICKLRARVGKAWCKSQGHDDGVPYIKVEGTKEEIDAFVVNARRPEVGVDLWFAEPDLPTELVPERPEDPELLARYAKEVEAAVDANVSDILFTSHVDVKLAGISIAKTGRPWGLERIGAVGEQALSDGTGVHVYVLDTGIRTTHQGFQGRARPTLDTTLKDLAVPCNAGDSNCARDGNGHGTHCAGTVAGKGVGVAPGATVHAVKVLRDKGGGTSSMVVSGIDWVVRHGERPAVISMSLGGEGRSWAEQAAINRAVQRGVTTIVAAGNEGDDACKYTPARVTSAITIGSTDQRDRRSDFSNYGKCVNLFAPGSNIKSFWYTGDRRMNTISGTSMATPHVAGAVARLLSHQPDLTPSQVRERLLEAADTNAIVSGLTREDKNLLLNVRGLAMPSQPVTITIKKATKLPHSDGWINQTPWPYCKCFISGKPGMGIVTPVVSATYKPSWRFRALLFGYEWGDKLECEVWHQGWKFGDYLLGRTSIRLGTDSVTLDLPLFRDGRRGGTLDIAVDIPPPKVPDGQRCCCDDESGGDCKLLTEDQLKASWNVFKFGEAVCPDGRKNYARLMTILPKSCIAPRNPKTT
eukprot:TRINITY_DN80487_c0_g1_i1.p1 TRINITY_DN80487_c0_g1~~TRINITY_DN80487_c0_g1_i1.p1  ORF type:complete len:679 (+),score=48.47 TRINITY_DN80487_c0_g1_i1:82-2118(+)